jgi:hypothetical protein
MFVHGSSLLARIDVNDCWYVDVHDEMNPLICCFSILVAKRCAGNLEKMNTTTVALKP